MVNSIPRRALGLDLGQMLEIIMKATGAGTVVPAQNAGSETATTPERAM